MSAIIAQKSTKCKLTEVGAPLPTVKLDASCTFAEEAGLKDKAYDTNWHKLESLSQVTRFASQKPRIAISSHIVRY